MLALLSILVIPYPFYSIYLQAFRLNKFCPLCLAVQITLVTEFIILLPVIRDLTFSLIHITNFLSVYSLTLVIYVLIREIISLRINIGSKTDRFNRFKRNPIIFRYLFIEGYTEDIEIPDCLVTGNPQSKLVVHAFLSLYCQPCAKAFRSLNYLYKNCNNVKINIILTCNANSKDLSILKICKDLSIEQDTDRIMSILSEWYRNLENRTRMQLPEFESTELQASEGILNVNKELFKRNKISGTPTILINNYKYPGQYEITDLEYYIDDIVELLEKKKARSLHPL
ncbi:MAG: vitamin K epoxide reductase family protein [Bacteroidales bacterium]|nr:vitamin K epoxide reductase family protein [Bacteroidales bacterium]